MIRTLAILISLCLIAACQPVPQQTAAVTEPMPVSQAQSTLEILGYNPGPVDGVMGQRTRSAIRAFQRDKGLTVSGALDARTSAELRGAVVITPGPADLDPSDQPVPLADRKAAATAALALLRREIGSGELRPVDLNDDGLRDYIARADFASGFCGAYLCSHLVMVNRGDRYEIAMNTLATAIELGRGTRGGFRDLTVQGAVGDSSYVGTARWDGRAYR